MARPVTLFTGQWADLPFEEMCKLARDMGYEGLELACWGDHIDARKAAQDISYCQERKAILHKYNLQCWAIGSHIIGQCVGDVYDPRLDNFAPKAVQGKPQELRAWAIEEMKCVAQAAKNLGVQVVTGFLGSSIWRYFYSFPQTTEEMIEEGYNEILKLWSPIFDVFDECGVRFALEVHPTEIAYDYYTAQHLLEVFKYRPTLGFNFDPSHLVWQGVNPCIFLRDFAKQIYHVHMKDAAVRLDGKAGILGSHIAFGDVRRAWNFRSLGHGDVDFDGIIRELNTMSYTGPLSVEWEDSGMERVFGATEACAYVKKINFSPSGLAFDKAISNKA